MQGQDIIGGYDRESERVDGVSQSLPDLQPTRIKDILSSNSLECFIEGKSVRDSVTVLAEVLQLRR